MQELQRLQATPAHRRTAARPHETLPASNLAPMHVVEDLVNEAALLNALIGAEIAPEQLEQYVQRQRVRPEDIQLTAAERMRANQSRRLLPVDPDIARRINPPQPVNARTVQVLALTLLLLLLGFWVFSRLHECQSNCVGG